MECLLCTMWARMPYAQKYTTPTSAQETEGAMVVGYWIASRAETVVRLCERHMHVLEMLDGQDNQRIEAERKAQEIVQQQERFRQQTSSLQQRRQIILESVKSESAPPVIVPMPVVPVIIPFVPTQNSELITQDFKLGPGPLANENIVTAPPPLPIEADPAQVYRSVAKPGTPEAALEMAKLIPIEGAKVTHPCPSCGVAITTEEVHAC